MENLQTLDPTLIDREELTHDTKNKQNNFTNSRKITNLSKFEIAGYGILPLIRNVPTACAICNGKFNGT